MAEHRTLHFQSVDEGVAEVERLAEAETRTSGKYSFPQIVDHLAHAFDISSGHRQPPAVPLPLRLAMRMLRGRIISRPMSPGVKLPGPAQEFFWDHNTTELDEAIRHFREAFARYRDTQPLPKHPLFGQMTREQNEQLQCRHMELHLGFVHPTFSGSADQ